MGLNGEGDRTAPTRRERYRRQTIDEIKTIAMEQVAGKGETAVSLNAIAKSMAMSPGALYRYFDNRDDLIADLVVDTYNDLGEHLQRAADTADPRDRLRAVARACRAWALRSPHGYRLVFESTSGSGMSLAGDRVVPAAQRSMDVFLLAIVDSGGVREQTPIGDELGQEVLQWGRRAGHGDLPAGVLLLALVVWTRLHGLISLELGQHLGATGVSAGLLFEAEVDRLVDMLKPRS